MLYLLIGVCAVTALVTRLPIIEIAKILSVLVNLPVLIYLSTKLSNNPSQWTVDDMQIAIRFSDNTEEHIAIEEIKYLRNVPRSGGNLIMLFLKNSRSPKRFWRNKLFEKVDDLDSLIHQLRQNGVEYYHM